MRGQGQVPKKTLLGRWCGRGHQASWALSYGRGQDLLPSQVHREPIIQGTRKARFYSVGGMWLPAGGWFQQVISALLSSLLTFIPASPGSPGSPIAPGGPCKKTSLVPSRAGSGPGL